jgi:formylglycine-generating enzyme required for sulfatase activity
MGRLQETATRRLATAMLVALSPTLLSFAAAGEGAESRPVEPTWLRHPSAQFSITATEVTVAQFRTCVEAGVCDTATADPACNIGAPERGDHPLNCVTFHGAEQYCAFAGGRICTEEEWLAACRGGEGRAFPYGDTFDPDACNARSSNPAVKDRVGSTAPVGSFSACEGGLDGLHDMAGNVAEWVDGCKGDYCRFRGAGYRSNAPVDHFAGCTGACAGNDKSLQSHSVGIRCCRAP